jgi:hypothetical protein
MNNSFQHLLDSDNKLKIPSWCKRIKIDVGTSVNAHNSETWLNRDDDVCVFGFEPNKYNVQALYEGHKVWPLHLKIQRINFSFFCIECALSDKNLESCDFYCTDGHNTGTSSLFKPTYFSLKEISKVPVITLEYFFDFFPWDKIEYIEQIKIDAQSSDYNIIKGMGKYLSEKIVYLDVETYTANQYENHENPLDIKLYMEKNGFECLKWGGNATFVNNKFKNILHKINYCIIDE